VNQKAATSQQALRGQLDIKELPGEDLAVAIGKAKTRLACVALHHVSHQRDAVRDLALRLRHLIAEGRLINLFPDWADERYPMYAYYPSRHHVPAKTSAFLDFVVELTSNN
jgi:hypothetical protein